MAVIVGCSDSRVPPEILFDQGVGDLFVVRVAGNVIGGAGAFVKGSIEYGILELGVSLVMVLGHSGCGAVDAAIKVLKAKTVLPGHLPALIKGIKPAVIIAGRMKSGYLLDNAVAENVRRQVTRLKSSPPIVQKLYRDKNPLVGGGCEETATSGAPHFRNPIGRYHQWLTLRWSRTFDADRRTRMHC